MALVQQLGQGRGGRRAAKQAIERPLAGKCVCKAHALLAALVPAQRHDALELGRSRPEPECRRGQRERVSEQAGRCAEHGLEPLIDVAFQRIGTFYYADPVTHTAELTMDPVPRAPGYSRAS